MRCNYLLILSLFGLFLPNIGNSQEDTSALLWEITGKKVTSPSYIFGTMHLIPKDDFLFPSHLQDKVKSTEVLIMEIGGLSDQIKMMEHLFLKEGNVFDFFSQPQKDSLFQYLNENLEIDSATAKMQFGRMKPMALMQLFTQQSFGEAPKSYEMSLEKIAKENGMEIQGLETIEEQIAIFDNMSMEDQVEMIMSSMRSNEGEDQIKELIEIYLKQDIEKLHVYMNQDDSGMMNYRDELLDNRNANWIPLIKKIIKKNSSFIAVGAGHLGGENGVIALLKAEGYSLKPIQL